MPDNEIAPQPLDLGDVPPLAPEHIDQLVREDARAAARAAEQERRRQEALEHKARVEAVESLKVRCDAVRKRRTVVFLEILDLIGEMPELPKRQRRAVAAEIFGLGRAEAGRLTKIGPLDPDFRDLMIQRAVAPELIEALLRSREDVREIALDEIEQGRPVEKADLLRLKRQLDHGTPAVVAVQKNRKLEASLVEPVRDRLKALKLAMHEFVPSLIALHRLGEEGDELSRLSAEVVETAASRLADIEACFGADRLLAAFNDKRQLEHLSGFLDDCQGHEIRKTMDSLARKWSPEELRLADTHDALRKLAAGELMPMHGYDEDTDHYLSRYLLEAVAWYADYDLGEYQAELEKLRRPDDDEEYVAYYGPRSPSSDEDRPLTSLELCAGAGGEAIGLHLAGFEPLGVFEKDKYAIKTLKHNHPFGPLFDGDLQARDFSVYRGKIDLLAGGVPCQPFSELGNQQRENDERDLFMAAVKIAADVQPRAMMLENVRGFARRSGRLYVAEIISELRKVGYDARLFHIAAEDYSLAQARPRVVLVAFRDGLMRRFEMPPVFPEWRTTVGQALHDLMAANGWQGADEWARRANRVAPTLVGGAIDAGSFSSVYQFDDWERVGIDARKLATCAPAADADMDLLPRLTPAMLARLQGFPEGWEFQGSPRQQRRQIGNAFPPVLAAAVGLAIRRILTGQEVDYEAVLSNLRFVPGVSRPKRWGDAYENSRLSLRAEELGLPTGIIPRDIPNPGLVKMTNWLQEIREKREKQVAPEAAE